MNKNNKRRSGPKTSAENYGRLANIMTCLGQNDDLTIGCPKRASDCPSRIERYPPSRAKDASNFVAVNEHVGEKK